MTKQEYARYESAVECGLRGLEFVSTGACPGCGECGLSDDCTDHDREIAGEPHFSWSACECCGSGLGGDRYQAHGRDSNGDLVHFEVCVDCLYYITYGRLDDTTMMEIGSER